MSDVIKKINDPDDFYLSMQDEWNKANALDAGEKAMKDSAETYLPMESKETPKQYAIRLKRSVFYPGFSKQLDEIEGMIFKHDITLNPDTPEKQKKICDNIDLQGNNLSVFCKSVLRNAEKYGSGYVFVDFPIVPKGATLADEIAKGVRPYWREVKATSLFYLYSDSINGQEMLTEIRIKETAVERQGFGIVKAERIRRYMLDVVGGQRRVFWELYVMNDKKEYVQSGGTQEMKGMDQIPLLCMYTHRVGFYRSRWKLEHLANLNVAHWVSSSDQRNILKVVRVPMLAISGKQNKGSLVISPNRTLNFADPNAKAYWVEHSGNAIEWGQKDLDNLKEEMDMTAIKMAIRRNGAITATEESNNHNKETSELGSHAMNLKDMIENGLVLNNKWTKQPLEKAGSVNVNNDFGIILNDPQTNQLLDNMNVRGKLSDETYYAELKRRGILSPGFDSQIEKELISVQGPTLSDEDVI